MKNEYILYGIHKDGWLEEIIAEFENNEKLQIGKDWAIEQGFKKVRAVIYSGYEKPNFENAINL